jgi:hypothetical protein
MYEVRQGKKNFIKKTMVTIAYPDRSCSYARGKKT